MEMFYFWGRFVYFMAKWYILWPSGKFGTFLPILVRCTEKIWQASPVATSVDLFKDLIIDAARGRKVTPRCRRIKTLERSIKN
jgi:hypothetical protein